MNSDELTAKMDELGKLMHEMEEALLDFDFQHQDQVERIDALKAELKPEILALKESVMSECLKAQYRKGAVKWETKWLDGYSLDHPEILKFRTEGKPTVAFVLREDND